MRPKTTGRFRTRRELVEKIHFLWTVTSCNQSTIARNCRVSQPTICNIIDEKEWKKNSNPNITDAGDWMLITEAPDRDAWIGEEFLDPFEPLEHLDALSLRSVGEGWMPDTLTVHLPWRVLHDLDLV